MRVPSHSWRRSIALATEAAQRWPELHIERKGRIAFTVHWRTAPRFATVTVADLRALSDRYGLAVQPARMAYEFRPPIPVDKGTALQALTDGSPTVASRVRGRRRR